MDCAGVAGKAMEFGKLPVNHTALCVCGNSHSL